MPPRRPPRPTPPDVDVLRTALGQGKLVRVGIAPSGQFPDGVTGRVRRIGEPAVDGDEFIFVEVPVGGAKDVLPFAPNDLIGAPLRKRADPAPARTQPARIPSAGSTPAGAPLAAQPSAARSSVAQATVAQPAAPLRPAPQRPGAEPSAAQPVSALSGSPRASTVSRPAHKAPAAGRGKRAPVSITISTTGDESASWRIEARIGAKIAVRPTSIPPTRVWDIVQSLGEPKLTTLVQSLLDDHRRSTQARADALGAELSALQAELKSFPE